MFEQRVASIVDGLCKAKEIMQSAEKPRYKFTQCLLVAVFSAVKGRTEQQETKVSCSFFSFLYFTLFLLNKDCVLPVFWLPRIFGIRCNSIKL